MVPKPKGKAKAKAKAKAKTSTEKVKKNNLKEKADEGPGKDEQQTSEWKLKACFSMQSHVEILVRTCGEFSLQHCCRAVLSACGFIVMFSNACIGR